MQSPTGDWRGEIVGMTPTGITPYVYTFELKDSTSSVFYNTGDPTEIKSLQMVTTEDGNTCPWSEV
jgi:hypothetical protein